MKNFKNTKGFSLVETILVFSFIAVATTLIYGTYAQASKNVDILDEVRNLDAIRSGTINLFLGETSYATLTKELLQTNNIIPSNMLDKDGDGNLILTSSKFKLPVTIASASLGTNVDIADNGFVIEYDGITNRHCIEFVTQAAPYFDQIEINKTVVKSITTGEYNVDLENTFTQCNINSGSTILKFSSVSATMNSNAGIGVAAAPAAATVVKPIQNATVKLSTTETASDAPTLDALTKQKWGTTP